MLFRKTAENLSRRLGEPTLRSVEPKRRFGWVAARGGPHGPAVQVMLEAGPQPRFARVWIVDPFAPPGRREEIVPLTGENDIDVALERVREHTRGWAPWTDDHAARARESR